MKHIFIVKNHYKNVFQEIIVITNTNLAFPYKFSLIIKKQILEKHYDFIKPAKYRHNRLIFIVAWITYNYFWQRNTFFYISKVNFSRYSIGFNL